jgi:4-hydroxy 2-oxovalerate aldolase
MESVLIKKSTVTGEFKLSKEKKVLLIASGKNINSYTNLIDSKINDNNYIVIGINHMPKFECDYYFFTNQKRFNEFQTNLVNEKLICTNNLIIDMDTFAIIDFSKVAFLDNNIITNSTIILINYLISANIKRVELAGLDGYKIGVNNYSYDEGAIITDNNSLLEENKIIQNALDILSKSIDIKFITASIFKEKNEG